jgi:hypothetical protein
MITTYRLTANELTTKFLTGLKTLYKGKTISITVEEELDETEYLLQSENNRKMLEESLNSDEGYEFSPKEFKKLSKDLSNGRKVDFSKVRKVKLPK